jgi:hypothetical protein
MPSKSTQKSVASPMSSYARVAVSTLNSRLISKTLLPLATITIQKPVNRHCISLIDTAKELCSKRLTQKERRLLTKVVVVLTKKKAPFDKAYWKGKTCFKWNGKDHPASHCTNPTRLTRLIMPSRMTMQQALLAASTNSRKRSRRCPKLSLPEVISLNSLKRLNLTCLDPKRKKSPLISSMMTFSKSPNLSPSLGQRFSKLFKQSNDA